MSFKSKKFRRSMLTALVFSFLTTGVVLGEGVADKYTWITMEGTQDINLTETNKDINGGILGDYNPSTLNITSDTGINIYKDTTITLDNKIFEGTGIQTVTDENKRNIFLDSIKATSVSGGKNSKLTLNAEKDINIKGNFIFNNYAKENLNDPATSRADIISKNGNITFGDDVIFFGKELNITAPKGNVVFKKDLLNSAYNEKYIKNLYIQQADPDEIDIANMEAIKYEDTDYEIKIAKNLGLFPMYIPDVDVKGHIDINGHIDIEGKNIDIHGLLAVNEKYINFDGENNTFHSGFMTGASKFEINGKTNLFKKITKAFVDEDYLNRTVKNKSIVIDADNTVAKENDIMLISAQKDNIFEDNFAIINFPYEDYDYEKDMEHIKTRYTITVKADAGSNQFKGGLLVEGYRKEYTPNNTINIDGNTTFDKVLMAVRNVKVGLQSSKDAIYNVNGGIALVDGGKLILENGTLVADNLRNSFKAENYKLPDIDFLDLTKYTKQDSDEKSLVLQGNGVIKTATGQIFAKGIDQTNDETVKASKPGEVTNNYIDYVSGRLEFTDAKYTLEQLKSMKEQLQIHKEDTRTDIVMLGKPIGSVNLEDVVASGSELVNAEATVDNKFTDIIIGAKDNKEIEEDNSTLKTDSASLGKLDVGNATNLTITGIDKSLTLSSDQGGNLLFKNGDKPASELEVSIKDSGTLIINTVDNKTSEINTKNVSLNNGTIDISGLGAAKINKITFTGTDDKTINIVRGSKLSIDNINIEEGTSGHKILVGDRDSKGTLELNNVSLKDMTIYLDPIWKDGQKFTDASKAAIEFADNTVNAKILVGENSILGLGVKDSNTVLTKIEEGLEKGQLDWNKEDSGVLAGLYIDQAKPQTIDGGSIVVDPKKEILNAGEVANPDKSVQNFAIADNGKIKFGKNSVFVVNLDNTKATTGNVEAAQAALKLTANADALEVASNDADKTNGSKLMLLGTEVNKKYAIVSGGTFTDKWDDKNIKTDKKYITAKGKIDNNIFSIETESTFNSAEDIANAFGNKIVGEKLVWKALNLTNDKPLFKLYDAIMTDTNNPTDDEKIAAINSVANLTALSNAQNSALRVNDLISTGINTHITIDDNKGENIWATYLHRNIKDHNDLVGMNSNLNHKYNGVIIGGDFLKTDNKTVGAAFSYIDGNSEANNIATTTKNDSKYYAGTIYGKIADNDLTYLADVNFMRANNEIKQTNSGIELKTKGNQTVVSLGVGLQKDIKTNDFVLTPYAGLRYTHLGSMAYTDSSGIKHNVNSKGVVSLPLGVKFTKEFNYKGWDVKAGLDVSYTGNFGNKGSETISYDDVNLRNSYDIINRSHFGVKLGIQAQRDDYGLALGYEYGKSNKEKLNTWYAQANFKF